jgi:hypothetical protein
MTTRKTDLIGLVQTLEYSAGDSLVRLAQVECLVFRNPHFREDFPEK